jgi:ArsR family transcriptional regulator
MSTYNGNMGEKRYNILIMLKALANETRLSILKWLADPDKYFPDRREQSLEDIDFIGGVSVADIQKKAGKAQSTTSHDLDLLVKAGFLEVKYSGRYSYFRRNQKALKKLAKYLKNDI